MSDTAINVTDLCMVYKTKTVLDHVSLTIPRGQHVALLGPNGAGKSTLVEILAGFRRPSAGRVRVLGENPLTDSLEWRSKVSMVFQIWNDHKEWRVRDFLAYVATSYRLAGQTPPDVDGMMEAVGVSDKAKARLKTLSGGQRRRVDVAAALLGSPELLFLDEPTTGFDPEIRRSFHSLIKSLGSGTTVVWTTHDLAEAEATCDRIVMLSAGAIVADGSARELRSRFTSGTRVSWRDEEGLYHEREVERPASLLAELAVQEGVTDIEVRQSSLEDIYMAIFSEESRTDAFATTPTHLVGAH